ncbi:Calmodulin-dependent protein kinase cmk2 [Blastocladiella emersonii ATCC 22665]|nr:Calmodulin-dependent protein kinase cmk2 [Blastocladiella emersonii ATCC 22665]
MGLFDCFQPKSYGRKKQYEFGRVLGRGTYGVVREAIHLPSGSRYACKVIEKKRLPEDSPFLERELASLERVRHVPHIVHLVDHFESRTRHYLVCELALGGEVFDRIVDCGRFTEYDAAMLIRNVVEGIASAHARGIVHRDLKPENLLFRSPDDLHDVMIADFGVSRIVENDESLLTVCGSPGYCAPEILLNQSYSQKCDMWSIGVITFTLLCGYSPFGPLDDPKLLMQRMLSGVVDFHPRYWTNISDQAKDFIQRLLTLDQHARLTSAEALRHPWLVQYAQADTGDLASLHNLLSDCVRENLATIRGPPKMATDVAAWLRALRASPANADGPLTRTRSPAPTGDHPHHHLTVGAVPLREGYAPSVRSSVYDHASAFAGQSRSTLAVDGLRRRAAAADDAESTVELGLLDEMVRESEDQLSERRMSADLPPLTPRMRTSVVGKSPVPPIITTFDEPTAPLPPQQRPAGQLMDLFNPLPTGTATATASPASPRLTPPQQQRQSQQPPASAVTDDVYLNSVTISSFAQFVASLPSSPATAHPASADPTASHFALLKGATGGPRSAASAADSRAHGRALSLQLDSRVVSALERLFPTTASPRTSTPPESPAWRTALPASWYTRTGSEGGETGSGGSSLRRHGSRQQRRRKSLDREIFGDEYVDACRRERERRKEADVVGAVPPLPAVPAAVQPSDSGVLVAAPSTGKPAAADQAAPRTGLLDMFRPPSPSPTAATPAAAAAIPQTTSPELAAASLGVAPLPSSPSETQTQ